MYSFAGAAVTNRHMPGSLNNSTAFPVWKPKSKVKESGRGAYSPGLSKAAPRLSSRGLAAALETPG